MTVTHSAILNKARKLQALADNPGATVAEAAMAAAKLQELLIKHHIEEQDIPANERSKVERRRVDLGKGNIRSWRQDLFWAVARNNGCKAVSWTGHNYMDVVGHEASIDTVLYLYTYLKDQILRLAKDAYAAERAASPGITGNGWGRWHAPTYFRSFCQGALGEVGSRLRAQRKAAVGAVEDKALVPVLDAEVQAKYEEEFPSLGKAVSRTSTVDASVYRQGAAAAKGINLSDPVGGGNGKQLRG